MKIFARVLFSRNFAYAKFREIKLSRYGEITLSSTDICKNHALFAKIKFSRKFPNLQYQQVTLALEKLGGRMEKALLY